MTAFIAEFDKNDKNSFLWPWVELMMDRILHYYKNNLNPVDAAVFGLAKCPI